MLFPLGLLGQPRGAAAGGFGYFTQNFGGAIYKIASSSDTTSTSSATLSVGIGYAAGGMSNSGVAGYVNSGFNSVNVDKIAFPADTRTTLATGMSLIRGGHRGMANVAVAGYLAGGLDSTYNIWYNTVDKFAFPADTRTTVSSGLQTTLALPGGCANSGTAGYYFYGQTAPGNNTSAFNKFTFPADTLSANFNYFSTASQAVGCVANKGVAAYTSNNTKISFPSDTLSNLTTTGSGPTGASINGLCGYISTSFGGGNTVAKLTFATETTATLPATFAGNVGYQSDAFANSGVF
jgi:hypothetical protein